MCKSKVDGGQRCHGSTFRALAAAVAEVEAATVHKQAMFDRALADAASGVPESLLRRRERDAAAQRLASAQGRLLGAQIAYASTEQGRQDILGQAITLEVLAGRSESLRIREEYLVRACELRDAVRRGDNLRAVNAEVGAQAARARQSARTPVRAMAVA